MGFVTSNLGRERYRFGTAALALVVSLWLPCGARAVLFQPTRITADTGGSKSYPKVSGDRVVWLDFRSSAPGMYCYQFSTGTETRFMSTQLGSDFRGSVLSYNGGTPRTYNIDTGTGHELSPRSDTFIYTSLGSTWAAWSSSPGNGEYDVYARRIQADGLPTGSIVQITSEGGVETQTATDGDYVAWSDRSGSNTGVWVRNMTTGTSKRLGAGDYPAVRGDRVTWSSASGLWVYDISADTTRQISSIPAAENPGLWGDQVVWMNGGHLYGYNLASGTSFDFTLPTRAGYTTPYSYSPRIDGDTVVWTQYHRPSSGDSYVYDLYAMQIPEPVSCILLAIGGLAAFTRRGYRG
jgi:beta propeller repeat protein